MTHSIVNWLRNAKPMRSVETDKVSSTGTIVDGEDLCSAKHASATFSYLHVPNQRICSCKMRRMGDASCIGQTPFRRRAMQNFGVRCFGADALTVFGRELEGASVEKSISPPLSRIWKGEKPTQKSLESCLCVRRPDIKDSTAATGLSNPIFW